MISEPAATFEEWLTQQLSYTEYILASHSPGTDDHSFGTNVKGTLWMVQRMYREYTYKYRVVAEVDYECEDIGVWTKHNLRVEIERQFPTRELNESNPTQWIVCDSGGCPMKTYNLSKDE